MDTLVILETVYAFLFGLIYGSFLNVLLWRLPEGEGIGGRSRCRNCGHQLAWYDLVPVLSFLILRGKCRSCRQKISFRYLAVELTTGIVLAAFWFSRQPALGLVTTFSVFGILVFVSLFFFDLFYFILPDVIVLPAIGLFSVYDLLAVKDLLMLLVGALLITSFFVILYTASRGRWLGFGDIKLVILILLVLGFPVGFWAIIFGIWGGALFGLVLLASRKATMKKALPFGSFLTLAAMVLIIFQRATDFLSKFFR